MPLTSSGEVRSIFFAHPADLGQTPMQVTSQRTRRPRAPRDANSFEKR